MTSRRALAAVLLATACAGDDATPAGPWDDLPEVHAVPPELAGLPRREEQYRRLCARGRGDSFFRALCSTPRPELTDLASLIRLSGLAHERAFALTGNSTSLVMQAVSAVNPRMIVFPRVDETRAPPDELTALGFVRGEPFVEIVSRDLESGDYNFYLFAFERSCDYAKSGCDLAALLSEEIEHGWTAFSVYTEEDLENTPLDCRSCHQPAGYGTQKILRMQELESPWLHWFPQRFVQRTDSDRLLTAQFLEAHRVDAQYGGIPISTIEHAVDEGSGAQLEALLVAEGQAGQPNAFDPRIEKEAQSGEESATWRRQFEIFLTGDAIAVPYPLADVTDGALRAEAVRSYLDVVSGGAPRESLRDLRDLFSEDARRKLGLVPPPGADGRTILTLACARCHDGRGNPELPRNAFNVKRLDELAPAIKLRAISRLQEPEASPRKMPPPRAGTLSPEAIAAAIAALSE